MPLISPIHLAHTPREAVGAHIVLYATVLSFSGALHGFNTANISGVMSMKPFIKSFATNEFDASEKANFTGWVTSALLLGSLVGSVVCFPINNRFGRNISLSFFSLIFIVAAILMAVAPSGRNGQIVLLTGRVLSGVGSGAASVIGTNYISEIAPKAIRGGLSALYNANTMLGVGIAYWINYGSLENISSSSDAQWQVPLAVQALPGVILMAGLPFIPESPRWLLARNNAERAQRALERLRRLPREHEFVAAEYAEILTHHEALTQAEGDNETNIWLRFLHKFRQATFRKQFILVAIIQVFFQFSGGNIITYYNTSILTSIGLRSQSTNFLFSGIYGCIKFVTVIIYSLVFVDRYGRRPMLFIGSALIVGSLIYMSAYLGLSYPETSRGGGTSIGGWIAVVAIYIFAIGYAVSWATIPWIINSEVFTTDVRSVAMAVIIAWQYLVNFALTRAQPNMVAALHPWGPFALFACATMVGGMYCYFALPETRGLSLEQMEGVFQGCWYGVGRRSLQIARNDGLANAADHDVDKADGILQKEKLTEDRVEKL